MIGNVLTLLQTFFDIVRLRQGPDAVPYSPLLFGVTLLLWGAAGLLVYAVVEPYEFSYLPLSILLAFVGAGVYSAVVIGFGKRSRLLQMLTALFGTATVLQLLLLVSYVTLSLATEPKTAIVVSSLIALWAVAVDGHIISRTVDREFFLGFLIALGVLMLQLQLGAIIRPAEPATM